MTNQFVDEHQFVDEVLGYHSDKSSTEVNLIVKLEVLKKELQHAQEQRIKAEIERDVYVRLYKEERERSIPQYNWPTMVSLKENPWTWGEPSDNTSESIPSNLDIDNNIICELKDSIDDGFNN